jgi:carotenoid biosynthesis protein
MIGLELVCLAIVATYVLARLARAGDAAARHAFTVRFATLAVASFVGEDTVIRAYGFYAYATGWSARLDQVPLVIVLVWPVVIDSAASLARAVLGGGRAHAPRVALLGAAIVLADASLIEPIAVRAGLWRWIEPGLFAVPIVGIVGWAFFAWAAILVLERAPAAARLAVVVLAPVATHVLVVASYWVLFRWIAGERSTGAATALVWGTSVVVSSMVARASARGRGLATVPLAELLLRLPGAAFFFVLLGMTSSAPRGFAAPDLRAYATPVAGGFALLVYAAAFAPPYLTALAVRTRASKGRPGSALA